MTKPLPRYLTKSRYRLTLECPAIFFLWAIALCTAVAASVTHSLKALTRGGFRVGGLTQCYFSEGAKITSMTHGNTARVSNILELSSENLDERTAESLWVASVF